MNTRKQKIDNLVEDKRTNLVTNLINNIKTNRKGCWEWQKAITNDGYGQIFLSQWLNGSEHGTMELTHRIAYRLFVGPIPEGMVVMHSCNNPRCVNPAHLSVGTQIENVQQRDDEGRTFNGGNKIIPKEVIVDIITDRSLTVREMVKRHNVSVGAVNAIRTGKQHKNLYKLYNEEVA